MSSQFSKEVFGFKKQLSIGNIGEERFQKDFEKQVEERIGHKRGSDFTLKCGTLLELKSDSYRAAKNFFIETISMDTTGVIGGPWQARGKGARFFIYKFIDSNGYHCFELTKATLQAMSELCVPKRKKSVRNVSYNTIGYAIPIGELIEKVKQVLNDEGFSCYRFLKPGDKIVQTNARKVA